MQDSISQTNTAEAISLNVIANGLNNPRDMTFGPNGNLYVTEAGSGGNLASTPVPSGRGNAGYFLGNSAAITKIDIDSNDNNQEKLISDLPSVALSTGPDSPNINGEGPNDIQFDTQGNPYVVYGFATNPATRDQDLNSLADNQFSPDNVFDVPIFASLHRVNFETDSLNKVGDLGKFELLNNPDGEDPNSDVISNPFGFTIKNNTAYIADSGANDLLSVDLETGEVSLESVFRSRNFSGDELEFPQGATPPSQVTVQSVPTNVEVGPNGAIYVSELTGFPFPEGEARIFRIGPDGEKTVYANNLTQVTDFTFDEQGNLYALQFANDPIWSGNNLEGSLIKISPDGTQTTLISGNGIVEATALTVGPEGNDIYISTGGNAPGGKILQAEDILQDKPAVELSINPMSGSEADQTTFTLTATASVAVTGEQTVDLVLSGMNPEDFAGELPTTISIADGETTGSVEVTVNDDQFVEGKETATFAISNPSDGIALGEQAEVSSAIADNEPAVTPDPIKPRSFFDQEFYLNNNPDVADAVETGVFDNAFEHFSMFGLDEARDPSEALTFFTGQAYLENNPDVDNAVDTGIFDSGLAHFLRFGVNEGRSGTGYQFFDPQDYLGANPDVAAAVEQGDFNTGLEHFLRFGFEENRSGVDIPENSEI